MSEQRNGEGLLSSHRVLDLTDEKGLLCGRVLSDLGAKLGLDYESCRQIKPDIIRFSTCRFGQKGTRRNEVPGSVPAATRVQANTRAARIGEGNPWLYAALVEAHYPSSTQA